MGLMSDEVGGLLAGQLAQVSPDDARPGVLGLVVVLGLIVATALLMVSFTRHLRRVDFEEEPPADPAGPVEPRDESGRADLPDPGDPERDER